VKKPDPALQLIDQCLQRGYRPGVTVVDAGYGNNTPFLKQLESRKLVYVAAVAKNRQVSYQLPEDEKPRKRSLAEIAQALSVAAFTPVSLHLDKPALFGLP
jgi:SRSO17 transposase